MLNKFFFIFFLAFSLFLFANATQAAEVYLDPAQATYAPGDVFVLKVKLNTQGDCINTAQIGIKFSDPLQLIDFSTANSFLNLWVKRPDRQQVEAINQKQKLVFVGGIPGGYCGVVKGDMGESNVLGELVFTTATSTAKTAVAKIGFSPETQILLHDGQGTKAKLTTRAAEIVINPQAKAKGNEWQKIIKKDDVPPQPFVIELLKNQSMFEGKYYIMFSTTDKQSGLDHYEVKEQKQPRRPFWPFLAKIFPSFYAVPQAKWQTAQAPYVLKDQSLNSLISVKAVDKAGNERIVEYFPEQKPAAINRQWIVVFVGVFVIIFVWLVFKIFKHKPL
jgi:hypothetical protein